MAETIEIYTDGACTGNPGHGGYGVVLKKGELRKELSEGYRWTTNNRMEMTAVIVALQSLKADPTTPVVIHTDSRLIVDAVEKGWIDGWKRRGWRKADKSHVLNTDLWMRIDGLISQRKVDFKWVKGHSGIEENERCDELATTAAEAEPFKIDNVYESDNRPPKNIIASYEYKLSLAGEANEKLKPKNSQSVKKESGSDSESLKLGRVEISSEIRPDGKVVVHVGSKKLPAFTPEELKKLTKWINQQSQI